MKTHINKRDVEQFVAREVYYCVSELIYTLSQEPKYMDNLIDVQFQVDEDENGEELVGALEHWIVSDRLASKLEAKGEMILKDFLGLTIWGRTTSGQAIAADEVIQEIYQEIQNA